MKKKATLREVAELAGISIATVSHVINKTRYVSPELVEKVERIMRETGYADKVAAKEKKIKVGKGSIIVGIFPEVGSAVYRDIITQLNSLVTEAGYQFVLGISEDDPEKEHQLIMNMISQKNVAGLAFVPAQVEAENYKDLINSRIPFVCVERSIKGVEVNSVQFKDREAIFRGANYLIESGHKNILYIREDVLATSRKERTEGFLSALGHAHINSETANILEVDLANEEDQSVRKIQKVIAKRVPTAVIASGSRITLYLMQAIRNAGLKYPDELSVIGFGDENWTQLIDPPLTMLKRDTAGFSKYVADILIKNIEGVTNYKRTEYADIFLDIQKSTRMLDNGPYGEKAVSAEDIVLNEEERKEIRKNKYRVIIAFHYTGTAWAELHEKGIRTELERYGIEVISAMDAHFDPELQIAQLESIRIQKPDAVIAVPTDDKETAEAFTKLSEVTKLVFLGSIPENMAKNAYVSFVSVNEWENGTNVGRLMGDYCKEKNDVKVGMIIHGATFYATRARDQAAERTLQEKYRGNVEIVAVRNFSQIENAYTVCKEMIETHPEIQALYVSWDRPALLVIKALEELGRTDIAVFTTDLDREIAKQMSEGIVKGMSTQRPFEQGQAAALVVAKSLVSSDVPKYVGVQPYAIKPAELQKSWLDIFHSEIPTEVINLRKKTKEK